MHHVRHRSPATGRAVLLMALGIVAVSTAPGNEARAATDPIRTSAGVVHQVTLRAGRVTHRRTLSYGPKAFSFRRPRLAEQVVEYEKLGVELATFLKKPGLPAQARVIVLSPERDLDRRLTSPLRDPDYSEPADSPYNLKIRSLAQTRAERLHAQRATETRDAEAAVVAAGGTVIERFWIIPAFVADVPVTAIEAIAARKDVVMIDLVTSSADPPYDAAPAGPASLAHALRVIAPSPAFAFPHKTDRAPAYVAILDSGVASHSLFGNVTPLKRVTKNVDCTDEKASACTDSPIDVCDGWHGTATAALIAGKGGGSPWDDYVPALPSVASYRVYRSDENRRYRCAVQKDATIRAIEEAVDDGSRVLLVETQLPTADDVIGDKLSRKILKVTTPAAIAADAAVRFGAVVVAPVGNQLKGVGADEQVIGIADPAAHSRVIAVGSREIATGAEGAFQRKRFGGQLPKPDIITPTGVTTAGPGPTNSCQCQVFNGTSGAAPFGAIGAALLREWLKAEIAAAPGPGKAVTVPIPSTSPLVPPASAREPDPGEVAVQLILAGTAGVPGGSFVLPAGGTLTFSRVVLKPGSNSFTLPITLGKTQAVSAAAWWPSGPTSESNVRLVLKPPKAGAVGGDTSRAVARRVLVKAQPAGRWTLDLSRVSAGDDPQAVYWAMLSR